MSRGPLWARSSAWAHALVVPLAVVGCSDRAAPAVVDTPYEGMAFPRAAPSFTLPDGPYALVSNNGSDDLSVVDATTHTTLAHVPIGLNPVDRDGPHHLAVDALRGHVFVALAYPQPTLALGPHAAHGSGTRGGKLVRLDLPGLTRSGEARTDDNPGDIVLSEDGARLVVSHYDLRRAVTLATQGLEARRATLLSFRADAIAEVTPATASVSIPICIAPHGVVLDRPHGDRAYAACYGEDAVAVVDFTTSPPSVERVPVGPAAGPPGLPAYGPYALTLSPDGTFILVGDTEGKDLRRFDTPTRAMSEASFAAGGAVYFSAIREDGVAFVPVQIPDRLVRVRLSTMTAERSRSFLGDECRAPHEAVLRANGDVLLVCEGDHQKPSHVLVLDPDSLETTHSWDVGVYPDKVVVVGDR